MIKIHTERTKYNQIVLVLTYSFSKVSREWLPKINLFLCSKWRVAFFSLKSGISASHFWTQTVDTCLQRRRYSWYLSLQCMDVRKSVVPSSSWSGDLLDDSWRNLRPACPKCHTGRFSWQAAFTTVRILFILFVRPASLYCEEFVYIYVYMPA
jgi:hypothetical protein